MPEGGAPDDTVAAAHLDALRSACGDDVTAQESYGQTTYDVPLPSWVDAMTAARDLGFSYFDWLTAVDELEEGFHVVAHLWSVERAEHLFLRTSVLRIRPELPTVTGVFAGAAWHERETAEMFGIDVTGHPHLVPLLLPDGFEGHPLRKEFVLAARAAKPWPGAKEPGESDADTGSPGRRKTLPPGVPDESWGPRPPAGAGS